MRHSIRSIPSLMAILCSGLMVSLAMADNDHHNQRHQVQAHLSGFNEVHFSGGPPATLRGAVSTVASGTFTAKIDEQDEIIHYELTYQDLEGTVTQGIFTLGSNTRWAASWSGSVRQKSSLLPQGSPI